MIRKRKRKRICTKSRESKKRGNEEGEKESRTMKKKGENLMDNYGHSTLIKLLTISHVFFYHHGCGYGNLSLKTTSEPSMDSYGHPAI
jgi:hypothetical protein